VDIDTYDLKIEIEATSRRLAKIAGNEPRNSSTFIAQPSSSSSAPPQTLTLPCIVDNDSSSSQVLDLSYHFSPRVTLHGEFILNATYTFTSPTKSSQLLSQIQALNFRFCPHLSTSGKIRRGKSPRPLISEIGTAFYNDCCEFCYTEFELEVQYTVIGVQKADKVVFRFWYSLGNGEDVGRDVIWQTAKGNEVDGSLTKFERRGIKQRWDAARQGSF
jgi:hypothetical protein